MTKLPEKRQRFADEFIVDLNATQAAIRAGYSRRTAYSQGQRLLKDVEVQRAIQAALKARSERTEITADRVLEEYAKLAFTNLPGIVDVRGGVVSIEDFQKLTPEQQAAIAEVSQTKDGSLRIKLHSKQAALDSLGKHLGMFIERKQIDLEGEIKTKPDLSALSDEDLAALRAKIAEG